MDGTPQPRFASRLEPDAPDTFSRSSPSYDPDARPPGAGLDVLRAVHRALGIGDAVELEVMILTNTPVGELGTMAAALRKDARFGMPRTATLEEVDSEAIRILHEMAGLVPSRWRSYPASDGDYTAPDGSHAAP